MTDFTTFWSDFFTIKTVQPFQNAYSFDEIYGESGNQTIEARLQELLSADSLSFIHKSMAKTFQVMNLNLDTLNQKQKTAMQLVVDPSVVPITKSECVD